MASFTVLYPCVAVVTVGTPDHIAPPRISKTWVFQTLQPDAPTSTDIRAKAAFTCTSLSMTAPQESSQLCIACAVIGCLACVLSVAAHTMALYRREVGAQGESKQQQETQKVHIMKQCAHVAISLSLSTGTHIPSFHTST